MKPRLIPKKLISAFICLSLVLVLASALPPVHAAGEDWLNDWAYRVSLVISASDVDGDLTHFPVLVTISDSCGENSEDLSAVFDEVGASYLKIAFTEADGDTQLYAEVEEWDAVNEVAFVFVSKNTWVISSSSDTTFYLYFDSEATNNTSYVGSQASSVAQNVWDSNYELALQLSDDNLQDSTNHNNDGTNDGSIDSSPAYIGDGRQFDDDDNVYYSSTGVLDDFTIDFWVKLHADGGSDGAGILGRFANAASARHNAASVDWSFLHTGTSGVWRTRFVVGGSNYNLDSVTNPVIGSWVHVTVIRDDVNGYLYLNGNLDASTSGIGGGDVDNDHIFHLGSDYAGTFYDPDCSLDKVTISSTIRGGAWIAVNHLSDGDNLLDWGAVEELPTEEIYISFYLNTGGLFYVDSESTANGTSTSYENETVINLLAAPNSSDYVFSIFNWSTANSTSNPYNYTVTGNNTIWCLFAEAGEGGVNYMQGWFLAGAFICALVVMGVYLIYRGRR